MRSTLLSLVSTYSKPRQTCIRVHICAVLATLHHISLTFSPSPLRQQGRSSQLGVLSDLVDAPSTSGKFVAIELTGLSDVKICKSRFDRVLFSVINTPGLNFADRRELKLECQVNSILKFWQAWQMMRRKVDLYYIINTV
jgi:hypothetical protein